MRDDILAASIRVLRKEGPLRFTTLRVAESAGISIGSLYQYFPNKQSLVFAIHQRTVELAWNEMQRILDDGELCPREKVTGLAQLFFFAESDEVREMGAALKDAEIFFDDQPGGSTMNDLVLTRLIRFLKENMPAGTPLAQLKFGAQLIFVVIESVGKSVANLELSQREIGQWAATCGAMISDALSLPPAPTEQS